MPDQFRSISAAGFNTIAKNVLTFVLQVIARNDNRKYFFSLLAVLLQLKYSPDHLLLSPQCWREQ